MWVTTKIGAYKFLDVIMTGHHKFITPIFTKLDLIYGGFDIAEDQNGQLYLIEINSVPGYAHYLENNGEEKLLTLFKKILSDLNK